MEQAIGNTPGHFSNASAAAEVEAEPSGPKAPAIGGAESNLDRRHVYAGREWSSEHSLNIRVSIPLGIGRYYFTIVAGKERRARARLALDRRQHPLDTPGNALFLALIVTIAAAGSVTVFYLLLAHFFGWSGRLIP